MAGLVEAVEEKVEVGSEKKGGSFLYAGLRISEEKWEGQDVKYVDMDHYIDGLELAELPVGKDGLPLDLDEVLDDAGQTVLRGKTGETLWVGTSCRADVAAKVSMVAGWLGKGRVRELVQINKLIEHLKKTRFRMRFPKLGRNLALEVYNDSAFGNLPDGGSQGGFIILVRDTVSGLFCPLSWASRKLRRVTRSTIAAETEAMVEGIDEGVFLGHIWDWIFEGIMPSIGMQVYTDCKSLYDHLKGKGGPTAEKRLRISMSSILEDLTQGKITDFNWIVSEDMLADGLTKDMSPHALVRAFRESRTEVRMGLKGRIKKGE
jgi:hypothetical protein